MKSSKKNTSGAPRKRSGAGLALAVGLLWGAAIGVTWYFYQHNDTKNGIATFLGRFHILMVHMPIGLLFVVPLMEMVGWTRWGKRVREGVPFVLWMAVLTAAAASFLGYLMMQAEDIAGRWMTLHMWTGLAVGVFAVLALVFKLAKVGPLYFVTLLAAVGSTAAAGHFGGAMIHSPEYLSEHAPEQIKPMLEAGLATGNAERGTFDKLIDSLLAVTHSGESSGVAGTESSEHGEGESHTSAEGASGAGAGVDGEGEEKVSIPNQLVFDSFVLPILRGKCTECHSEEKIKGKLRLDNHAMIMAGAEGTDYPTVVPGDADGSELIARVVMPEDDDLFMPPEGKDKLTEAEIAVLKWWIAGGAKAEGTVSELKADEKMLEVLAAVSESLASGEDVEIIVEVDDEPEGVWPTLSDEEQQQRLDAAKLAAKEGGFSILPVSAEDDRLRVSAVNASASFGDEQLAALAPVAERVVWLDIGRTQVSDEGMANIGQMPNLERLHLEQTKVTDAGMKHLAALKKLEYLNLYGTEVTAAIFEPMAELRNLRKLFLWETKVDPSAAREFQRQMSLEVNTGWDVADNASAKDTGDDVAAPVVTPAPAPAPAKEQAKPAPAPVPAAKKEQAKPASSKPVEPKLAPSAPASKPAPSKPAPAAKAKAADAPTPALAKPATAAKPNEAKPAAVKPAVKPSPTSASEVEGNATPKPNAQ